MVMMVMLLWQHKAAATTILEAAHAWQQGKSSLTAQQLSSAVHSNQQTCKVMRVSMLAAAAPCIQSCTYIHAHTRTSTAFLMQCPGTACPPVIDSASAAISSWAHVRILSSGRSCCSSVLASMTSEALTPDMAAVLARLLGGRGDAPSRAVLYTSTARSAPNGARPCRQPQQCVLMPLRHVQAWLQLGVADRLHCCALQYMAVVRNELRANRHSLCMPLAVPIQTMT